MTVLSTGLSVDNSVENLSLAERVSRIEGMFTDPTSIPAEFRSWLPSYIESSSVQIPVSQISGNFLSATATTSLGGDINGRTGLVRSGSSPYDFFQMTYDGVYGKWISNPVPLVAIQSNSSPNTTSTSFVTIANTTISLFPWRAFDTAALTPQFRVMAIMLITGGATASICAGIQSIDIGGAANAVVNQTAATTTSGSAVGVDTNWVAISGVTLADLIFAFVNFKTSSGAQTVTVVGVTLLLRWVSK